MADDRDDSPPPIVYVEEEFDWDLSPYTIPEGRIFADAGGGDATLIQLDGPDEYLDENYEEAGEGNGSYNGEPVIPGLPPRFYQNAKQFQQDSDSSDSDADSSEDEDDLLLVESETIRDTSTIFGQAFTMATVSESQSLSNPDNREQVKNAAKIVDKVTKVPLSTCWHRFTQAFFVGIFIANIAVEMADIITGPEYFHFKVTSLFLAVIETTILVCMWFYLRRKKSKISKEEEAALTKKQQYTENIMHEVLLYPIIIMATLGFASEKMYETPDEFFGWLQLILLAIDVLDLIWTQTVRMFMAYRFVRDLQKIVEPEAASACCGSKFAGNLLPKAFFTILGNTFLFMFMIYLMGAQMLTENYTSEDYSMKYRSILLMLCLIFLPLFSILLFLIANSYWVVEILITVNLRLSQSDELQKKLQSDHNTMMVDAVGYAMDKAQNTQQRLDDIQNISTTKKVLYALSEFPVILMLLLWEAMVLCVCLAFGGYENTANNIYVISGFGLVTIIANWHLILLVVVMNGSLVVILPGVVLYPLSLMLCFWKKPTVSPEEDEDRMIREGTIL